MAGKMLRCSLWIFVLAAVTVEFVASIDDKCGACNAVAGEIELGLSNEKPRNHLDMRHRLDSKGQRQGKVIDYRVSELRAVELLDGLCGKMQDYTLVKFGSSKHKWSKIEDWDNLKADKQEARANSKRISSFCGRLLDEREDELIEKNQGRFCEVWRSKPSFMSRSNQALQLGKWFIIYFRRSAR